MCGQQLKDIQSAPVDGRTMFEGINLINSDASNFQEIFIDTNVVYDTNGYWRYSIL